MESQIELLTKRLEELERIQQAAEHCPYVEYIENSNYKIQWEKMNPKSTHFYFKCNGCDTEKSYSVNNVEYCMQRYSKIDCHTCKYRYITGEIMRLSNFRKVDSNKHRDVGQRFMCNNCNLQHKVPLTEAREFKCGCHNAEEGNMIKNISEISIRFCRDDEEGRYDVYLGKELGFFFLYVDDKESFDYEHPQFFKTWESIYDNKKLKYNQVRITRECLDKYNPFNFIIDWLRAGPSDKGRFLLFHCNEENPYKNMSFGECQVLTEKV